MSDIAQLSYLSGVDILKPSSRFPATLSDESMPPFTGLPFKRFEDALRHLVYATPGLTGKIEVPLELPMKALYRTTSPNSSDRLTNDFRIVSSDREIAPVSNTDCSVMPYVLFNGIVSVALHAEDDDDHLLHEYDGFWLNVLEEDVAQPFSGVTDSYIQVMVNQEDRPPHEIIGKYLAMHHKAGSILERLFNTQIAIAKS